MLVSTRGRYALRLMIDLAECGERFVPLKEICERQEISVKYLELITADLVKAGLVVGVSGRKGGYKLNVDPSACTVKDVLAVTEGDVAPVSCLKDEVNACPRADDCRTLPLWEKLYGVIDEFFGGVTLASLCKKS